MKIRIDGTPEEIEQAAHIFGPSCGPIKLTKKRDGGNFGYPEAARDLLEAQVEPYRDQIAALEREVERLTDQIANRDADAVEAIAQAEQRIEDLKRENAQLRDDLALSRRLEGFHWPWTRDRIKAQHLLPKSTV